MAEVILMPRLSDDMSGGVIVSWHKKIGEPVKRGDLLAEIETEKATMELESYKEGILLHIGGKKGDTINVNGLLCIIGHPEDDISKFISHIGNDQPNVIKEDASNTPIFFSYSRDDSEFALKLIKDIRNKGQKVWIDISDIRPGQPWHKEVQNALKNARSILVILSQSSVDSNNVLDEIFYALDKRKNIIPIMINDCEMPYGLHRLHYIDFRGDYNVSLKQLVSTLSALV